MTARLVLALTARFVTLGLALVAAVSVLLLLLRAAPGDAVDLVTTDAALRARMATAWQLDVSLPVAVGRALSGAWGTSHTLRPGQAVSTLLAEAATASMPVLVGAVAWTLGGGALLGSRSGPGPRRVPPLAVAPVFLLGWLLIVGLNESTFWAIRHGHLARPDWFSLPDTPSTLRTLLACGVLSLGSGNLTAFATGVRVQLDRHRASPAIETRIARGMPVGGVLARLLVPDLALLLAERVAFLFGGLVVLEKVFAMPGLGSLFFEACVQRDQPVVLASGVVAAAAVVAVRLLADVVRMVADPRLRGLS